MTQQEVAEHLHVSDKAVSRWERDASAPDLSLIPILAELFGVTCDELLRGEYAQRNTCRENDQNTPHRPMRLLVNRALSGFRTLCWLSLTLSAVGLVCMFGIAYGFYRPIIGFAVMLVFATIAAFLAVLAVNRLNMVREDNELFEQAEESTKTTFARCLGDWSFAAFFGVLTAILLSLPLILFTSDYIESVLSIHSYLIFCFGGVVLLLWLVWLRAKPVYVAWVNGQPTVKTENSLLIRRMNVWQVGLSVLAVVLFAVAPYFETAPDYSSPLYIGTNAAGLACLAGNILLFVLFLVRHREYRRILVLPGVRNMLYIVSALMAAGWHNMGFTYYGPEEAWNGYERYDYYDMGMLLSAIEFALLVTVVCGIIQAIIRRRNK